MDWEGGTSGALFQQEKGRGAAGRASPRPSFRFGFAFFTQHEPYNVLRRAQIALSLQGHIPIRPSQVTIVHFGLYFFRLCAMEA